VYEINDTQSRYSLLPILTGGSLSKEQNSKDISEMRCEDLFVIL